MLNPILTFFERHGKDWTPAPFTGERGERKGCFRNALHYALDHNLRYVEGVAVRIAAVHHAWCVTDDGTVVDPTWDRPEECRYRGIAFDADDAKAIVIAQGFYGLFDSDTGPNWDLIRQYDPDLEAEHGATVLLFRGALDL